MVHPEAFDELSSCEGSTSGQRRAASDRGDGALPRELLASVTLDEGWRSAGLGVCYIGANDYKDHFEACVRCLIAIAMLGIAAVYLSYLVAKLGTWNLRPLQYHVWIPRLASAGGRLDDASSGTLQTCLPILGCVVQILTYKAVAFCFLGLLRFFG